MILHELSPIAAFLLNVCLAVLALLRDGRSPLNRVFASLAGALAVWTFGVFMLRRTVDPDTAWTWQCIIHAGVASIPGLYSHFVASFLGEPGETPRLRRPDPILVTYAIGGVFALLSVTCNTMFIRGVEHLTWGWAPLPGPLYAVFVVWFNATVVVGLWRLRRASRGFTSSFRRNRARLIVLGTAVGLGGSVFDFFIFVIRRLVGSDEFLYPSGVIANMVFALFMGISIIRYRMFDVGAAVRQFAVYGLAGGLIASLAAALIRAGAQQLAEGGHDALWLIAPGAAMIGLALSPLGRRAGEILDRVTFRRRAGCYDTLLELSRGVGTIRTPEQVAAALVEGVATGVPVTHCTLLTPEPGTTMLTCVREHVIVGMGAGEARLAIDGPVVGWVQRTGRVLVREGTPIDAALAARVDGGADELAGLRATVMVPLQFGSHLAGVLAIGEKLSGELFDAKELDVLRVLGSQTALALDNARLLRESEKRLRRAERLNAELDSFVASTSHDLKAPLVTLDGLSGLVLAAEGHTVSPTSRCHLESIQTNVRCMAQLVADLLTISLLGRETRTREAVNVNVDAMVDEVLEALADPIHARSVRIVRAPLGTVRAFPRELATVFRNLVDNAVTHLGDTPEPRIEIGMRAEPDALEYWVRDNGVGIDPACHPKASEMFQRPGEVAGMGLTIVKRIVEAAGGRVWLDAARGHGTTVRFTWPRTDGAQVYRLAATTPAGHATPVPPSPQ